MPRGLFKRLRREWREGIVLGPSSDTVAPSEPPLHFVQSDVLMGTSELGDIQWYSPASGLVKSQADDIFTSVDVNKVAVTATADGSGTGTIPTGATFVTVTSGNADHIVVLPPPVTGAHLILQNAGTGYELRSSDPATIGINGGAGAGAESAIAANITTLCDCVTATNWVCNSRTSAGVVGVTQVAAA